MLMVQMNEVILLGLEFALSLTIHLNTARNYLKELGYICQSKEGNVYR